MYFFFYIRHFIRFYGARKNVISFIISIIIRDELGVDRPVRPRLTFSLKDSATDYP
jgi:hypothetical protein